MKLFLTLFAVFLLSGCATAMTASQFYSKFPEATEARYLDGATAKNAVEFGACTVLDEHRYAAPIGLTVYDDVRNGAEGVDGIVSNEGGNAYRIVDFSWLPAGGGATQLHITFQTLDCLDKLDDAGEKSLGT